MLPGGDYWLGPGSLGQGKGHVMPRSEGRVSFLGRVLDQLRIIG